MPEDKIFKYQVGDKTFIQKKLVLGQIRQLIEVMQGIELPAELTTSNVMLALKDKIHFPIAVVLTEEGKSPRDKEIDEFAKWLEFELEPEKAMQIIEDFFGCNPIVSLLERLSGMVAGLTQKIRGSRLKNLSASSQEGTLQKEIISSGDSP